MKVKNLKARINEMPDNATVTKVHIETINKFGERELIEFEVSDKDLTINKGGIKNEKNN
jgi:hypothetical protein